MARVNLDDSAFGDWRFAYLAGLLGISKFDARGRCEVVWWVCYRRRDDVLPAKEVDGAAEMLGFGERMVEAELAERVVDGFRIRGARERFQYLVNLDELARKGGAASASRRNQPHGQPYGEAHGQPYGSRKPNRTVNPPSLALSPALDLKDPPVVPQGGPPSLVENLEPGQPMSPTEREVARRRQGVIARVIGRLNENTGHAYDPKSKAAQRHLLALLKRGVTEAELRAVVWHRSELWKADPKMAEYLRPETLFAGKFDSYLAHAKTAYGGPLPAFDAEGNEIRGPDAPAPPETPAVDQVPRDEHERKDWRAVRAQGSALERMGIAGGDS